MEGEHERMCVCVRETERVSVGEGVGSLEADWLPAGPPFIEAALLQGSLLGTKGRTCPAEKRKGRGRSSHGCNCC